MFRHGHRQTNTEIIVSTYNHQMGPGDVSAYDTLDNSKGVRINMQISLENGT